MISIFDWWILIACLAPAVLFQWYLMYRYYYDRSKNSGQIGKSSHEIPVSLIVCARNELENLKKNLPAWAGQKYSKYEIVIVNDRSWDDTRFFLEEMTTRYSNLRIVHVPDNDNYWTGKKLALTLGIKASKNDILLLTDADCSPASEDWISNMMKGYLQPHTEIVLGYGRYFKLPGFLNMVIRFETLQTGWLYLSAAWAGLPFMGIGRNLSYRKHLFFKTKGFYRHMHLSSGDDDLFINEVATARNTQVILDPGAVTVSIPKKTWSEYLYQRRRHFTTSSYFRSGTRFYLFCYQASRLIIGFATVVSFSGLILSGRLYVIPLAVGLMHYIMRWHVMITLGKKAGENSLGWWYPIMSPIIFLIQVRILAHNILIGSPKGWNKI